ncbi:MFS transporter [Teredinibacter turnerae]|uniref:MFS transporter n=1 Tax=Teredinibacter turnerae TaxID=2426 RepID=UPI00036C4096|nr:MFS transporter [Teredinibacter turnerae]
MLMKLQFPRNIWVLALTLALTQGALPLMVLVSGLLSSEIAPDPSMATLPLAVLVVGTALSTIPAAWFNQQFGRKHAGFAGVVLSLVGILLCMIASTSASFGLLITAAGVLGASAAFFQHFRFAAMESVASAADIGPALAIIMLSGIIAGVLGPELVSLGAWLLPEMENYLGAFLLMALLIIAGAVVFSRFQNTISHQEQYEEAPRPLARLVCQPVFLLSMGVSALGYAVMVFLMTSTPLSMHLLDGHSLADAKWVIQSHLVAMFLPSIFSGWLMKRLGAAPLMLLGSALYLGVIAVALTGHHVIHYWWALVLLGVGWNFLFLSGTSILPQSYRNNERFKVQAANDFAVFALQAIASLVAGWVLFTFGWQAQLWLCVPVCGGLVLLSIAALIFPRYLRSPAHAH